MLTWLYGVWRWCGHSEMFLLVTGAHDWVMLHALELSLPTYGTK